MLAESFNVVPTQSGPLLDTTGADALAPIVSVVESVLLHPDAVMVSFR